MKFTKFSILFICVISFISCYKFELFVNYSPDINSEYLFSKASLFNIESHVTKTFKRWVVSPDGYNLIDSIPWSDKYQKEFITWIENNSSLNRIDKFHFLDSSHVALSIKKEGVADYDTTAVYEYKSKRIVNYEEGKSVLFGLSNKESLSHGYMVYLIRRVNKNNTDKLIERTDPFSDIFKFRQNIVYDEMLEPGDTIYQGSVEYYYELKK